MAVNGCNVDDATAALTQHVWQHRSRTVPGSAEVARKAPVPVLITETERLREHVDACVVDQDVDFSEMTGNVFGKTADAIRTGNIRILGLDLEPVFA